VRYFSLVADVFVEISLELLRQTYVVYYLAKLPNARLQDDVGLMMKERFFFDNHYKA